MSASVKLCQHLSASLVIGNLASLLSWCQRVSASLAYCQHCFPGVSVSQVFVSICQRLSASASICQHLSASVSICQHLSASVSVSASYYCQRSPSLLTGRCIYSYKNCLTIFPFGEIRFRSRPRPPTWLIGKRSCNWKPIFSSKGNTWGEPRSHGKKRSFGFGQSGANIFRSVLQPVLKLLIQRCCWRW